MGRSIFVRTAPLTGYRLLALSGSQNGFIPSCCWLSPFIKYWKDVDGWIPAAHAGNTANISFAPGLSRVPRSRLKICAQQSSFIFNTARRGGRVVALRPLQLRLSDRVLRPQMNCVCGMHISPCYRTVVNRKLDWITRYPYPADVLVPRRVALAVNSAPVRES